MLLVGDLRSIDTWSTGPVMKCDRCNQTQATGKETAEKREGSHFLCATSRSINNKTRQRISFRKLTSISSLSPRSSQIDDIPFAFIPREDGSSGCDVGCIPVVMKKRVAVSEHLVARGNGTTSTRKKQLVRHLPYVRVERISAVLRHDSSHNSKFSKIHAVATAVNFAV
jgi:hypothetical protein